MRFLLDTHLLLWAAARSRRLSVAARALLEDPRNEIAYSAVSLWEIAIKLGLRRRDFRVDLAMLRPSLSEMGLVELPMTGAHAERVATLPPVHRDPFDRMLVAQCLVESIVLITNDDVLENYGDAVRLVKATDSSRILDLDLRIDPDLGVADDDPYGVRVTLLQGVATHVQRPDRSVPADSIDRLGGRIRR